MLVWVCILNSFATWALVGLIWFVQLVHYPLFNQVSTESFLNYHREHMRRTSWVVVPLMLVELSTSIYLVKFCSDSQAWIADFGISLLAIIWISTFLLQVPQHEKFSRGFNAQPHRILVYTNWIRTVAWTGRGILSFFLLTNV